MLDGGLTRVSHLLITLKADIATNTWGEPFPHHIDHTHQQPVERLSAPLETPTDEHRVIPASVGGDDRGREELILKKIHIYIYIFCHVCFGTKKLIVVDIISLEDSCRIVKIFLTTFQ